MSGRRSTRVPKGALAIVATLLLTAASADAHSGHGAGGLPLFGGNGISFTFGSIEPDTMTVDYPAGWRFAHDDQYGNELASNPNDEDQVGSGSMHMAWTGTFCGSSTQSLTFTWEEDMAGGPSGAVAHYVMSDSWGDTDVWVVEQNDAADDYKLSIDFDEARTCPASSQPSGANIQFALTSPAEAPPTTSGCYDIDITVVDTSGTTHAGTVTRSVGGALCL